MVELNKKEYWEVFVDGNYENCAGFLMWSDGKLSFRPKRLTEPIHISAEAMWDIADKIIELEDEWKDDPKLKLDILGQLAATALSMSYIGRFHECQPLIDYLRELGYIK